MRFDLVDLRLLVNIAEANSLTQGAERSHMSLPAASLRVKGLEDSIGSKLLNRSSQGVTLTPPGRSLVHHARLVQQQIDQLTWDMAEYVGGVKGHVRLLANTSAITEFLPAVLGAYLSEHPEVNIDLKESLSPDIIRAISDGGADIGIVAGEVHTALLQTFPYRIDRLVLVAAPAHPLAQTACPAFAEVLDYDYVSLTEASAIHSFVKKVAHEVCKPIKLRIQVGNFEALCRMIEAGIGIGIAPESAARRHAKTMDIRLAPLSDEWAKRNLKICVRNIDLLPAFARALVEQLVADGQRGD